VKKPVLNFLTVATGRYRSFVFPYIISALWHNKTATAEILVNDLKFLRKEHKAFLNRYFDDRWAVRLIAPGVRGWKTGKHNKSIRWLSIPRIEAEYTYIGDIDILILESNIEKGHALHAEFLKKPYSNVVRNHKTDKKMTGLHFVETSKYFSKVDGRYLSRLIKQIKLGKIPYRLLDECLLYRIVKDNFGLPDRTDVYLKTKEGKPKGWERINFRPIHGIHLSLGRIKKISGWSVTDSRLKNYNRFKEQPVWKEGLKLFDARYLKLLSMIEPANRAWKQAHQARHARRVKRRETDDNF
jgi:hypothetical protein